MNASALVQIAVDLFLGVGLFLCAMKLARAPKDDPRLSRGLQLLQSKIAVLEDLADKADAQAHSLTALLEQKGCEVQTRIQDAERHVRAVAASIERSREVAKIFEDKIPHSEIIERQNTVKYVQAARLAHQGLDAAEIGARVDLPRGELEFIAKINKQRLMFSEEQLPWWANGPGTEPAAVLTEPREEDASMQRLGDQFRAACELADRQAAVAIDEPSGVPPAATPIDLMMPPPITAAFASPTTALPVKPTEVPLNLLTETLRLPTPIFAQRFGPARTANTTVAGRSTAPNVSLRRIEFPRISSSPKPTDSLS